MKIDVIVDSMQYARSNCYVHQLLATLDRNAETRYFDLAMVKAGKLPVGGDRTLSLLKQRTLHREIDAVEVFLGGKPVYCYDQDPWEAFKDDSPYKGTYDTVKSRLNLVSFLNTSTWWTDFAVARGIPAKFVKMWMLPEYCSKVPNFDARKIDVGFCGTLHQHRKDLLEELEKCGITVTVVPYGDYSYYLRALSQMKIFLHSEKVRWVVEGVPLPANSMWIKDVEACARGCISMREYEPEACAYDYDSIPAMIAFASGNITQLVNNIRDSLDKANEHLSAAKSVDSVEFIRSQEGWKDILKVLA